jgi:hypothetical protein
MRDSFGETSIVRAIAVGEHSPAPMPCRFLPETMWRPKVGQI